VKDFTSAVPYIEPNIQLFLTAHKQVGVNLLIF